MRALADSNAFFVDKISGFKARASLISELKEETLVSPAYNTEEAKKMSKKNGTTALLN